METVHDGRLHSLETKNVEMKRRFDVKFENEKYNNDKQIAQKTQKDNYLNNKFSYSKFRQQDQRGYDILTLDQNRTEYRSTVKFKDDKTEWEKILDTAANKTHGGKTVYKNPHDVSDNVVIRKAFMEERQSKY
jgi:hypothetical protein